MNSKFFGQFDINVDTEDPFDLSLAIASRGVVEASTMSAADLADPGNWAEAIDRASRPGVFTSWRAPGVVSKLRPSYPEGLSAQGLADAWREASHAGVRLAVQPAEGASWGSTLSAANSLSRSVIQAGLGGQWPGVSSVVVPRQARSVHSGGWPISIGVVPSELSDDIAARIRKSSMFRRDLATVSVARPGVDQFDLLIAPFSIDELPRRIAALGLSVKAGAIAAAGRMGAGRESRSVLSHLYAEVGAGVIATGLPIGGMEDYWANELVRSISHGSTFDAAMWDADRASRQRIGMSQARRLSPLMIVGDTDFLSRSGLDQVVQNLASRIDGLGAIRSIDIGPYAARTLSLDPGLQSASTIASALRDNAKGYSFHYESDEATGVSELSQTVAAAEAATDPPQDQGPPVLTPPLHADPVFVEASTGRRVDDTQEALRREFSYVLKVGLRRVPTGISHRGQPQPVAPLPNDSDIRLLVAISDPDECFLLGETLQFLKVPANLTTDSVEDAEFPVTALRDTVDANHLATIEVRIYFEFNLIEHLLISAEVVRRTALSTQPQLGLPVPIFIEQSEQIGRSYQDIVRGLLPRQISIDVRQAANALRLTFAVRTGEGDTAREVVMHAGSDVSLSDITRALRRIRQLWEDVAVERFGQKQQISRPAFNRSLYQLARAGDSLWSLLFRGVQDSSIWKVGEWLRDHPPATGSLVDVNLLDGTTEFVFPWSMLYDRPLPLELKPDIDPNGFWGLRYCVQLRAAKWHSATDATIVTPADGARMDFMWWESFPNAKEQKDLLAQLATSSGGRLVVSEPIDQKPLFYDKVKNSDADILYFYTHGYTKPPEVDAGYNELARIRQLYEAMPDEDKKASGLQAMYELLSAPDFEVGDSWVALTYGRLELAAMRSAAMSLTKSPIVFLNMCQSAQILPGLSESFVSFFLERKARSVLGTECPMTTTFAHPFSAYLLEKFFAGLTLGEALRQARCHFMQLQNPLGLAYSLYGSANVRFDPPLVVKTAPISPTPPPVARQTEGA